MIITIVMAILLILLSAFAAIMRNAYFWSVMTAGIKLRVALSGLIFKKVLLQVILALLNCYLGKIRSTGSVNLHFRCSL